MCSSSPDTSGINAAAQSNAQIGQEALDFYKKQYADQAPARDQAAATAQRVSDAQLAAMGTATDIAKKDEAYREGVFQPLERGIVADAKNYDTLARRDQAAGQAIGDVVQAGAAQRAGTARDMARMGVGPNDGAYGAMQRSADTSLALGEAAAANRAREQVRTVGSAMKMDAASLGRGLPSSQATQAGIAINAGNSAVATGLTPVQIAQQGLSTMGQGFTFGLQGNQSAGNLYGNIAGIQNGANAANNAVLGGVGSAAGSIGAAVII
jgi:hypothetical protein